MASATVKRFLVNYSKGGRWQGYDHEDSYWGELHGALLRVTAAMIPIHWCGASGVVGGNIDRLTRNAGFLFTLRAIAGEFNLRGIVTRRGDA